MSNYEIKTIEGQLKKHAIDNITVDVSKAAGAIGVAVAAICETYGLYGQEEFFIQVIVDKIQGKYDFSKETYYKINFSPEQERLIENTAVSKFVKEFTELQAKGDILTANAFAQQVRIGGRN